MTRSLNGSKSRLRSLRSLGLVAAGVLLPSLIGAEEGDDLLSRAISGDSADLSVSLRIIVMMTVLTVAPSILLLTTSFTRIIIVLGFVRRALGTQEVPPNQVIVGLALILTFSVMAPTWGDIYTNAVGPYMENGGDGKVVLDYSVQRVREFMYQHIGEDDLLLMAEISSPELIDQYSVADGGPSLAFVDALPTSVVVPAFVLSELKLAFEMGFLIYLPFVVIDMVVASVLISMGMMMLPPVIVSLPFKILIFVLVDGWGKIVEQLMFSFAAA
jgi:flagellar biosynthetic protein FliP